MPFTLICLNVRVLYFDLTNYFPNVNIYVLLSKLSSYDFRGVYNLLIFFKCQI